METKKIREFINANYLSFAEGNRNYNVTTIIGYTQHLGLNKKDLETVLSDEIGIDSFIGDEIDRLWNYCKLNNYSKYWSTAPAKEEWKF